MSALLSLSTKIDPPDTFTVDGDQYQLFGIDHLSENDEAEAQALLARHMLLAMELERTPNVAKGTDVANKLRTCRIQVICKLTDLPKAVAAKLPILEQVKLLEALQEAMSGREDDGREPSEDDDAADASPAPEE